MEIFDAMDASLVVNDDEDLFNFTFQGQHEDELSDTTTFSHESGGFFPELMEEDLEWLSNKDSFPSVETCFGILSDNPQLTSNLHSPKSVLENNNDDKNSNSITLSYCESLKVPTKHPVRARSKRNLRRRTNFGDLTNQQCLILNQVKVKNGISPLPKTKNSGASLGRRCLHCQSDKTPQWRAGPMGPKTLCNACGVRYKSGRLVPEYRPASSPTFSSDLHSNSHKKVVEIRKKKHQGMNEACGYSLG